MEKERISSAKVLTRRHLTSHGKDSTNGPEGQFKHKSFKSTARQVWMANLLKKKKTTESIKPVENIEKKDVNTELNARPPSVKRKGTPEIFPMSSEMKKTLLLLGNLDLLPEDERQQQQTAINGGEKTSKFRLKTRNKIIHPQRFLRGVRNVVNDKQCTVKEEIVDDDKLTSSKDIIESETGIVDNGKHHDNTSENHVHLSDEEEVESTDRKINGEKTNKSARDISKIHPEKRISNGWNNSFRKYQAVYTIANPTSKTNSTREFDVRTPRKLHRSSKTWQVHEDIAARNYPIRRVFSLGLETSIGDDLSSDNGMNEGRTVEEIANDIQFRCSKWFEFRQKIMKQRDKR